MKKPKRIIGLILAALMLMPVPLNTAQAGSADSNLEKAAYSVRGYASAQLAAADFTVSFHTNGGNAVPEQSVAAGEPAKKPADPVREGKEFAGWFSNEDLTSAYYFNAPVIESRTLYAKWLSATEFKSAAELDKVYELPNPFRFYDGTMVTDPSQWPERRAELDEMYQTYFMGNIPDAPEELSATRSGNKLTITMKAGEVTQTVDVTITLPTAEQAAAAGVTAPYPLVIGDSGTAYTNAGYATASIPAFASQNAARTGILNNLFPYDAKTNDFTYISAQSWGVRRFMDALEVVAADGKVLFPEINSKQVMTMGLSIGGKLSLAMAAFEPRIAIGGSDQSGQFGAASIRLGYDGRVYPWRMGQSNESMPAASQSSGSWTSLNLQEMAIVGSTNGYTDGKGFGGAGTAKQYPWGLSVPKDGITFEGTTTPGYDDLFKVPVDANSLVALMAPRPVIVMGGTEHGWTIAESQAQSVFAARKVYEFLGADPRRAQVTLTVQGHTITSYNRNALLMMGQKYFRGIDNPILDQDIRWTEASSLGITSATNTAYADANAYTTPYTPSYDAIPWGIPGHYNIDLDASRFLQGYGASFTASTTADTISIYEPFGALIRTVAVADGKAKITLSPGETKEYGSYKLVAKGAGLKDGVQYIEVATNKITFFGSNNMFKYAKVIFDPLITTVKNNNDVAADNGSSVRFIFGARIDPTNVKVKVNGNEKFNGEVIDRSGYTQEGQEPYWYFPAPGYYSNNAVAVNDVSLANYQTAEFTGVRFLDFFPDLTFSFNFFKKAGEPTSSYDQLPSWTVDNYQAIGVSGDRILLSWPKANNAQSYSVFVDGKLVGSTEDNVYQLNELASGTSYNVKVAAVNQTGSAAENLAADIRTLEGPVPEGVVLNGTDAVKAGQSFDLTYGLNGVEAEILAQDITIEYDADLIGLVSPPVSTDDKKFVVVDYEDEPGKLRILGIHLGELQADPNGGQITLSFKAKSDATAGIANIKVANVIAANKEGVESTLEGTTHNVQIDVINKTALNELIDEAQGAHDHAVEGKLPGQYPAGSKALLQAAIDLAQGVAANEDASQTEVEQAASALNEALQTFKASVIEKIPGDSNNDNKISIGDLAIMAAAYGKTSADADWDSVKNYDRNADGAIDILDLVTLAREILNW